MSLALHLIQPEHVRAMQGAPAPGDPKIDVDHFHELLASSKLLVCNASLIASDLAVLRQFTSADCLYAGSMNAHAWPKTVGIGSPFWDSFRSLTKGAVQSDAFPEYKIGLAAFETVIEQVEQATKIFDVPYLDELFQFLPDWVATPWASQGVPPDDAKRRWLGCREHILRCASRSIVANIGSSDPTSLEAFPPLTLVPSATVGGNPTETRVTVTIEEEHGTVAQIVRALAQRDDKYSTCWPQDRNPSVLQYAPAAYDLEDLVLRGVLLPH